MTDHTFELVLTLCTFLILAGVVLGIIIGLPIFLTIVAGLVVEVAIGVALLYNWGKAYLAK